MPAERPSAPQIFPEHFDLGVTAGAVNYGFSPGDDAIPTPYVYVGPHEVPTGDAVLERAVRRLPDLARGHHTGAGRWTSSSAARAVLGL